MWTMLIGISFSSEFLISPTVFSGSAESDWRSLETKILNTPEKDIYIIIDGNGGRVDIAIEFYKVIRYVVSHGKRVHFIINTWAASAHANAICSGTTVTLSPGAQIYFHAGFLSKPGPKDYSMPWALTKEIMYQYNECKSKGILTQNDIKQIEINHNAILIVNDRGSLVKLIVKDENIVSDDLRTSLNRIKH